jgi:hypothetical protein
MIQKTLFIIFRKINLFNYFSRKKIFEIIFSESEQITIINALYRRIDDDSTKNIAGEKNIIENCKNLTKELIS